MRFIPTLFFVSVVLALSVAAEPENDDGPTRTLSKRSHVMPFNVAHPGATPAFLAPADPVIMQVNAIATLLTATTAGPLTALGAAAVALVNSAVTLNINGVLKAVTGTVPGLLCGLFGCAKTPTVTDARPTLINMGALTCLDSTANATVINSLFYYGGANTVVYLCEKAQIALESPVFFQFPNQTLTTATFINANRAKLTIANTDSTTAIMGAYAVLDRCTLSNLIIDGARPALGWDPQGNALIEMGGSNTGQKIDNVKVYEPRGWSAMHLIEGDNNSCSDAVVTNNDIGPSGNSPTGAAQFNRRNKKRATEYAPGQWADGISLACPKSTVTGNTITDATDGAIVIFGAPGSTIKSNTITQVSRMALGGVNAVDYFPFLGNFGGVTVTQNTFNAKSHMIKVGIAAGPSTWGSSAAALKTYGGSFSGNTFTSGSTGYFGYGLSVAGHQAATFTGNNFLDANFGGVFSGSCQSGMPAMQPSVYNPTLSLGNTLQIGFLPASYSLAICVAPGNITTSSVSYFGSI